MQRVLARAVVVGVLLGGAARADSGWRENRGPHVVLRTDLGSGAAREAALAVERFRAQIIAAAWPRARSPPSTGSRRRLGNGLDIEHHFGRNLLASSSTRRRPSPSCTATRTGGSTGRAWPRRRPPRSSATSSSTTSRRASTDDSRAGSPRASRSSWRRSAPVRTARPWWSARQTSTPCRSTAPPAACEWRTRSPGRGCSTACPRRPCTGSTA